MRKLILSVIAVFIAVSALPGCTTIIRTPPPSAKVEVRPAPPFHDAVWIKGRWKYKRGYWVWLPGHWKKRPGPKAVWIPGHWKETPRGWKWVPGHWKY